MRNLGDREQLISGRRRGRRASERKIWAVGGESVGELHRLPPSAVALLLVYENNIKVSRYLSSIFLFYIIR